MKRTKFPEQTIPPVQVDLIRSIAWTFCKKSKVEFDELFSEASLAYCEAIRKYDFSKGASPITWVFIAMRNALINFCKRETRNQIPPNIDWYSEGNNPVYEFFQDRELTEDCKFIIDMVMKDTERYTLHNRVKVVSLIKNDLREQSWSTGRILKAFEQLRNPKPIRGVFLYNTV